MDVLAAIRGYVTKAVKLAQGMKVLLLDDETVRVRKDEKNKGTSCVLLAPVLKRTAFPKLRLSRFLFRFRLAMLVNVPIVLIFLM